MECVGAVFRPHNTRADVPFLQPDRRCRDGGHFGELDDLIEQPTDCGGSVRDFSGDHRR
jgi:hypothetical protein